MTELCFLTFYKIKRNCLHGSENSKYFSLCDGILNGNFSSGVKITLNTYLINAKKYLKIVATPCFYNTIR